MLREAARPLLPSGPVPEGSSRRLGPCPGPVAMLTGRRCRGGRRQSGSPVRRTPEEQSLDRLARHRYGALVEELAGEDAFLIRSMFHCLGCYLRGRLVLVLAD